MGVLVSVDHWTSTDGIWVCWPCLFPLFMPLGLRPQPTAIASSTVDLPVPFSPITNVWRGERQWCRQCCACSRQCGRLAPISHGRMPFANPCSPRNACARRAWATQVSPRLASQPRLWELIHEIDHSRHPRCVSSDRLPWRGRPQARLNFDDVTRLLAGHRELSAAATEALEGSCSPICLHPCLQGARFGWMQGAGVFGPKPTSAVNGAAMTCVGSQHAVSDCPCCGATLVPTVRIVDKGCAPSAVEWAQSNHPSFLILRCDRGLGSRGGALRGLSFGRLTLILAPPFLLSARQQLLLLDQGAGDWRKFAVWITVEVCFDHSRVAAVAHGGPKRELDLLFCRSRRNEVKPRRHSGMLPRHLLQTRRLHHIVTHINQHGGEIIAGGRDMLQKRARIR